MADPDDSGTITLAPGFQHLSSIRDVAGLVHRIQREGDSAGLYDRVGRLVAVANPPALAFIEQLRAGAPELPEHVREAAQGARERPEAPPLVPYGGEEHRRASVALDAALAAGDAEAIGAAMAILSRVMPQGPSS